MKRMQTDMADNPNIVQIGGISTLFGEGYSRNGFMYKEEEKYSYVYRVEPGFIDLMKIRLVEGRNFNPAMPTDSFSIIVNESFISELGIENPLEEKLNWGVGVESPIIGVVRRLSFSVPNTKNSTRSHVHWARSHHQYPGEGTS